MGSSTRASAYSASLPCGRGRCRTLEDADEREPDESDSSAEELLSLSDEDEEADIGSPQVPLAVRAGLGEI